MSASPATGRSRRESGRRANAEAIHVGQAGGAHGLFVDEATTSRSVPRQACADQVGIRQGGSSPADRGPRQALNVPLPYPPAPKQGIHPRAQQALAQGRRLDPDDGTR